jgi:hypothetical protein
MISTSAKNALFIYILWQIPKFSAFIFANTLLIILFLDGALDLWRQLQKHAIFLSCIFWVTQPLGQRSIVNYLP